MGISSLPGLRQKVLTISCLAGARMLFTAVNWALGGFTPLNAVVLLVMLALEGLQLAGLWMCISEDKAQRGLYIHWLYGRIVYILSWVRLTLTGLTTLVLLFSALAGGKDGKRAAGSGPGTSLVQDGFADDGGEDPDDEGHPPESGEDVR